MDGLKPPNELSFEGNTAENWRRWLQQFRYFLLASGRSAKGEDIQCATLLHCAGETAQEIYNTFVIPDEKKNNVGQCKDIKFLIEKFEAYCTPKRNVTLERHMFYTRYQKQGETVDQFVTDLRILVKNCEFGDLKDGILRDRIVEGVNDKGVKVRLLREPDLTLEKCIALCKAAEASNQHMRALSEDKPNTTNVHAVKQQSRHGQANRGRGRGRRQSSWQGQNAKANQDKSRHDYNRSKSEKCTRCGYDAHTAGRRCPAIGQTCNKCSRPDHFQKMCKSKNVHAVNEEPELEDPYMEFVIDSIEDKKSKPWIVAVNVNDSILPLKLDTGSDVNVLSAKDCSLLKQHVNIRLSKVKLTAYDGGDIPVKGECVLKIHRNGKQFRKNFVVANSDVVPILGRKSCEELGFIKRVHSVNKTPDIYDNFIKEFGDTFRGLGKLPGKAHIHVRDDVEPVVEPCRRVPFGIQEKLKEELNRMQSLSVLAKVNEPTDWVSSLVVVHKPNGSLRVCLDPKNLNNAIRREHYKLPTREELSSRFAGSKYFSKLDCRSGYWMLELDDESSKLTTFNTPFGRYRYLRLPFGVSCASEIFQKKMVELFGNVEGVEVSQDDLGVHADTRELHDKRLRQVFEIAQKNGLKFNLEKCILGVSEITFIGDIYSDCGLKPDSKKIEAITKLERPGNRTELQSFLGMINYLARYLPDLSAKSAPLRSLLKKEIQWKWDHEHEKSWSDLKALIVSKPVLQYYDVTKPTKLSTDASQRGIGAVLLQCESLESEDWLPVAYASRSMTECEQRYAQIEKEALGIAFGCERFHQFLYGIRFEAETDHKPLIPIFSKSLNDCPARLQRLRIRLQRYDFELKFKPGKFMYTADALSRNYLPETGNGELEKEISMHVDCVLKNVPVTDRKLEEIRAETDKDEQMCELRRVILNGWPNDKVDCHFDLHPYWNFRDELSVVNSIVMKGNRVVVPQSLRKSILDKIHAGHMGIEKCKKRARDSVFWPMICQDVENKVKLCDACLTYRDKQSAEPLVPHEVPGGPWQKVATDLCCCDKADYLIAVDCYSCYPEVVRISSQTSNSVIVGLKNLFSRHGVPQEVFSDNGPCYVSEQFERFSTDWDFKHTTSSPHYPKSNGQVEKTVQIVKNILKKSAHDRDDPLLGLLAYRSTPIVDNLSPAELLMGRKLRSNLPITEDMLRLNNQEHVKQVKESQKQKQKMYHDVRGTKVLPGLDVGDVVRIRDARTNKWSIKAKVLDKVAPRSYLVKTEFGAKYRRNRSDLLATRELFISQAAQEEVIPLSMTHPAPDPVVTNETSVDSESGNRSVVGQFSETSQPTSPTPTVNPSGIPGCTVTRSGRVSKPPDRFGQKC